MAHFFAIAWTAAPSLPELHALFGFVWLRPPMDPAQRVCMDRLLRRLSPEERASFTQVQITALSRVLAGRYAAPSLLDWRATIRLGVRRCCVAVRIGLDRR